MADKATEAWYVERLRALWPGFPRGLRSPGENPDFIVQAEGKVVGIEVTVFTLAPEEGKQPTREQLSVRDQIIDRARAIYAAKGGPPLIIDIEFDDELRLTKRDVDAVAAGIAERLSNHSFGEDDSLGWHQEVPHPMPPGVLALAGGKYRAVESWGGGSGGVVRECSATSVQELIDKKAGRYSAYRIKCDEVVLLIVFSAEHDPQTEVPNDVLDHRYDSPFDATVALLADIPLAVELRSGRLLPNDR